MIDTSQAAGTKRVFRTSFQQRRLCLLLGESVGVAFAECRLSISGELRIHDLAQAVRSVAARYEILRTTFERRRGFKVPFQIVDSAGPEISFLVADELGESALRSPFDLERGPLFRARLAEIGSERRELRFSLPVLCADAKSLEFLCREIGRMYAERSALSGEPLQYADYADWQAEIHETEVPSDAVVAERARLVDVLDRMRLPGFRPEVAAGQPSTFKSIEVAPEDSALLEKASLEAGIPFTALFLALWQILLWRLTGESEIVVGVDFDGRTIEDLAHSIGPFSHCLPVGARILPDRSFIQVATQAFSTLSAASDSLDVAEAGDSIAFPFTYEFRDSTPGWHEGGIGWEIGERFLTGEPCRVGLIVEKRSERICVSLRYDVSMIEGDAIERIGGEIETLLHAAASFPDQRVGELEILSAAERKHCLASLASERLDPNLVPIPVRIAEQAAREPDRAAVLFGDREVSRGELSLAASRLAKRLVALGVGPEIRVGLLLDRSPAFLEAMLAVWKAGGAYVALDPANPPARLAQMLATAAVSVLITDGKSDVRLPAIEGLIRVVLESEGEKISTEDAEELEVRVTPESLAYVLFTSGSTGHPKGVAVEHRQLSHYVEAITRRLDLRPGSSWASVSTFAADLGHTALFPALASGGCVDLISQDLGSSPEALATHLARHPVDGLKIVPSHLAALLAAADDPARLLPRRYLVLGGEALGWELVGRIRDLAPDLVVFNHYGPTETTVGAIAGRVAPSMSPAPGPSNVPLGLPLPGAQAYLLDARWHLVAMGVVGEVFLGGGGLSRGYLERPDGTADRFIPDAYSGNAGGRLYRTGDLARFWPDGSLEFIGRADQQVKIRGFRIELGEIEAALAAHKSVGGCALMVREDVPGERRVVAYAVARRGERIEPAMLTEHLRQRLPEPMVPASVIALDSLPLTPNGKVDRTKLPAPERARPVAGSRFEAPRSVAEASLAQIWQAVLKLDRVGIHDNFFELGGDSILSIEVIARANRSGLTLVPRQIFQHQTIAELAAVVGTATAVLAEQGPVAGEVPLTPIQRWFFDSVDQDRHHWNQAVMLEVSANDGEGYLRIAEVLAGRHDALRLRFVAEASGWRQRHAPAPAGRGGGQVDLSPLPEDLHVQEIQRVAGSVQASLSLAAGPLSRPVLLVLGGDRKSRFLWVIHHLVVDAVSWRILLADLEAGVRRLIAGEPPVFEPKTTSYRNWSERLLAWSASPQLAAERAFWLDMVPAEVPGLPVDRAEGANSWASARVVSVELDVATTRALLQEVPTTYRTQVNDALLAALGDAAQRAFGIRSLLVELEGHGREPLFDEIDLSRTVGWFTSRFPVHLDLSRGGDPGAGLRMAKEKLRSIPEHGIGFGLLRYLADRDFAAPLAALPKPEIVFNYLGQFDQMLTEVEPIVVARESVGPMVSPRATRRVLFEVVASVAGGRLGVAFTYSANLHREESVRRLAEAFLQALREIVEHCRAKGGAGVTPSDFPLSKLDDKGLDKVLAALHKRRKSG